MVMLKRLNTTKIAQKDSWAVAYNTNIYRDTTANILSRVVASDGLTKRRARCKKSRGANI